MIRAIRSAAVILSLAALSVPAAPAKKPAQDPYPLPYPPTLPDGATMVTDESPEFLKPSGTLREGIAIAKTAPKIDFQFFPGQDHAGKPWSNWGEGCFASSKYYSAIGDHLSPRGTGLITEYDPATKKLRIIADVAKVLEEANAVPGKTDYVPGKVHSRIRMGSDGFIYYATHRGSPSTTTDAYGYLGDWILRTDPVSGKSEVVAHGPVPKHAIPMSGLDPKRMIFYGGTAAGKDAKTQGVQFLAYDLAKKQVLLTAPDGPDRCAIFSSSTGRVYWDGKKYDPATNQITPCADVPSVRSSTDELPNGIVYGTSERTAGIWAFDIKTEKLTPLGPGAVAKAEYTASITADPTGRFLYYIPGAHGHASDDNTPIVQFDTKSKKPKVIAFVAKYYQDKYAYTPDGTYSVAVDDKGETLFVTMNGMRKGQPKFWESCTLMAVHIPASERE